MKKLLNNTIRLRPVELSDLPALFEFQSDTDSNRMAFTKPRSKRDFDSHWERILAQDSVYVRSIIADDSLAGCISCFECDGQKYVGYWVGRSFWGNEVATSALRLLLAAYSFRPLHSRVATGNVASIRVLRKCGFQEVGRKYSPETDRYIACEEVVMKLTAENTSIDV